VAITIACQAACDRTSATATPSSTSTTSPTATPSSTSTTTPTATATSIAVPEPSFRGTPLVSASASATPPVPTGTLTQCRPIAQARPVAEGPDLDATGCPMKLRSEGELRYTLNAQAMAKQKKGSGLCCYDERVAR
jgi:hypothetical protein